MRDPEFLSVGQVERLHARLVASFGGTQGVRDAGAFEGAVLQPRNVFLYDGGDLFEIAAAYAFYIAQAQAFLDGNKRTGMAAALIFLEGNGITVPTATERLHDAMIGIAERRVTRVELAAVLRELVG